MEIPADMYLHEKVVKKQCFYLSVGIISGYFLSVRIIEACLYLPLFRQSS